MQVSRMPTIVLVHAAYAESSSWQDVIVRLQGLGYSVVAVANPLRGVYNDSRYLASVLHTITGPIVLVGHAYAGMVITNAVADNPNVKALVYVAAFIPEVGETAGYLINLMPGSELSNEYCIKTIY